MMKSPFPKDFYIRNAEVYKVLANPIRLEILNILKKRELSVEDITQALKIRKANVSQHLALLRHAGLVNLRREGVRVFYSLASPQIAESCILISKMWK